MTSSAYDKNGHTSLMRAAIDGDLELVEKLLSDGADPTLKDRDWGTSTAETYAARSAASSESHRKIKALLANATAKWPDSRIEPIASDKIEVKEATPVWSLPQSWPYGSTRTLGAYDSNGHTSLMRAAIDGDLELVEKLLSDGADPTLKDRDWGTSTAETYAARSAASSESHRKIKTLLANATAKWPDSRIEPIASDKIEVKEATPTWPYESFRTLRGNYIERVRTSVFVWSSLVCFSVGVYLIVQQKTFGGFLILTVSPCLLLYPLVRLLFGGRDSVGAVVTTVVVEEVLKSEVKNAIENRSKRRR
ncbi:MAG: ankyrin repeat domain-containing protein [Gammaproteobacteria bacterium]|nr:ankyrin repeat domain-containing protein [Gammaproteobacteria bacterium]